LRVSSGEGEEKEIKTMTAENKTEKKVSKKEAKKEVKKELEGKEVYLPASGKYQVRELANGSLMVYIKRDTKILVRLLPAIGNPKA
jgi:NADH:ubiquinone oxidoreductase subunit D